MKKIILAILLLLIFAACSNTTYGPSRTASYGVWESYGRYSKQPLNYADFTLRFINKTPASVGTVYNYSVTGRGGFVQNITWSSGAGEFRPTYFEVDGKKFVMEMVKSAFVNKQVDDYRVLVWQIDEYNRRLTLRNQATVR